MPAIDIVRRERNTKQYKAGQQIFGEGDAPDGMYVVDAGEVQIHQGDKVLELVTAGGMFGEMGLVDAKPRAASATAKSDCTLVLLNQGDFYFLVQHVPAFALDVMRVLSERVRRNTST